MTIISNCTFGIFWESQRVTETSSHCYFPFSILILLRIITVVSEKLKNLNIFWTLEASLVLLLGTSMLLNMVQILLRVK